MNLRKWWPVIGWWLAFALATGSALDPRTSAPVDLKVMVVSLANFALLPLMRAAHARHPLSDRSAVWVVALVLLASIVVTRSTLPLAFSLCSRALHSTRQSLEAGASRPEGNAS